MSSSVTSAQKPLVHQLPDTPYFNRLSPTMTLRAHAIYAESERRNAELGHILQRAMAVPLYGPLFYSPGGAALVERARELMKTDDATARRFRAVIASPGTAVLGLGTVAEDKNGVLMAGAAGPIMIGKSGYFLWTAGVNAEPLTIETPFQFAEIEMIEEALAKEAFKFFETKGLTLDDKQKRNITSWLLKAVEKEFFPDIRESGERNRDPFWKKTEISFPKEKRENMAAFIGEFLLKKAEKITGNKLTGSQMRSLKGQIENLNSHLRARIFAETVRKLANNYGFINIEDARGADLPLILGMLESMNLGSAIWSDDKQGTGVITAAGVLSWAEQTGRLKQKEFDPTKSIKDQKPLEGIKVVIFGAGAGAMGVYDELINMGVRHEDILVTDTGPDKDYSGTPHAIHEGREDIKDDPYKMRMRQGIKKGTRVEEFAKGADLVINLGDIKTVTERPEWLEQLTRNLAANPMMAFMTNPDPGVEPSTLHKIKRTIDDKGIYYASGNQLYENTVNNFTAFGYIGLGALLAGATTINAEMTVAASWAIHRVAKMQALEDEKERLTLKGKAEQLEYGLHRIVPDPTDIRLVEEQAVAVAMAAARSGVSIFLGANPTETALKDFEVFVREEIRLRKKHILEMRENSFKEALKFYREKYPDRFAPFYLDDKKHPYYYITPEFDTDTWKNLSIKMGTSERAIGAYLRKGKLNPKGLTTILNQLKDRAQREQDEGLKKIAIKELKIIVDLMFISPTLGYALALRRLNAWEHPENLRGAPTVFHKRSGGVEKLVIEMIPRARAEIAALKAQAAALGWGNGGGGNDSSPAPVQGSAMPAAPAAPVAPAGPAQGAKASARRLVTHDVALASPIFVGNTALSEAEVDELYPDEKLRKGQRWIPANYRGNDRVGWRGIALRPGARFSSSLRALAH